MAKGVPIGLSNVHYALLDTDPYTGVATYEAPVRIPGAISAKINPNSSQATLFADDGAYETASTTGQISLELNVADLSLDDQAVLFGHTVVGGVLIRKSTDIPPWVAVGFMSLKSNGSYRFTWLAKGKFSLPEQNNETKGDSVNFNTPTATASFVKRDSDDEWERHIDEDHTDFIPSMATNWFTGPYGGAIDTTQPTVAAIVPADAATTVVVTSAVTWTFNEPIAASTINGANFLVTKEDGTAVVGSLTANAGRTVVTFTPTSNLSAASDYLAIVTIGVKDLAGNNIAAPYITNFSTL